MESKNDLFIFQDNEQIDLEVDGYIWNGYEDIGKSRSILKRLEENADIIRGQLQHFIANQLADCSASFEKHKKESLNLMLWSSGLVEQGTLKTTAWLDSLRLLALNQELSEKNYSRIVYQGSNRAVHSCLWRLCKHKNIDYIWQQTRKRKLLFNLRTIWRVIPPYLRAPIYLFKYLFKRWKIRQVHTPKWATKKKSLFFLSYFIHLDQKLENLGPFIPKAMGEITRTSSNHGLSTELGPSVFD